MTDMRYVTPTAPVPITAVPQKVWKPAGTGVRLPIRDSVKSGNNFVAVDFAIGTPDHEVSEFLFFFPTFACKTPGAGGETHLTSILTIEGIATRADNGQCTLGTIDGGTTAVVIDPSLPATENGKWIKFVPASPVPAGATQVFRVAQNISDGTYARARIASLSVPSIYGGTVKDERSQGSSSSMLSFLSGSSNLGNVNGGGVVPGAVLVPTLSSTRSVLAVGDSKGYGADATVRNSFMTSRHALGMIDIGLDENTIGQRVQFNNWCISGWGFTADSTVGSQGNAQACARQLWVLQKAREFNEPGIPLADFILFQHGSNSSTAGRDAMVAGAQSVASIWRAAVGGPANLPIIAMEMDAYPTSSDGFNSVTNQQPLNVHQTYPDGGRWLFNQDIGGPDGLGDPTATLRADGTFVESVGTWRISSADLGTNRHVFKLRDFSAGLSANYSGSGDMLFDNEPALGEYLSFFNGTDTYYGHVEGVSGESAPFTVDIVGNIPALTAANTQIRSTYSGGGLHPGALYHAEVGLHPTDGVAGLKVKMGWINQQVAPQLTDVGIGGIAEDGETLTVTYTATGFPEPVVTVQWREEGNNISGENADDITLNASAMNLVNGDLISPLVTASNGVGQPATAAPSIPFVVPVAAPAPVFVDSIKVAGGSGAVSGGSLTATGADRQVFAMVGAGTSDSITDISLSITGTTGTVAMTRIPATFSGTTAADPSASLEAFACFVIKEAALPGAGPYSFSGTSTGVNVPDKMGMVAASLSGAPEDVTVVVERAASVSATPTRNNTMVLAALGASSASSGATLTGVTQEQNLFETAYGDGIQLGQIVNADQSVTAVSTSISARHVSVLALFAPN